jgi:hypothetical protein
LGDAKTGFLAHYFVLTIFYDMKHIFWTGYSQGDRHEAIDSIKCIVSQYGDLVDFKFFSDISLSMTIEIEALKLILYLRH